MWDHFIFFLPYTLWYWSWSENQKDKIELLLLINGVCLSRNFQEKEKDKYMEHPYDLVQLFIHEAFSLFRSFSPPPSTSTYLVHNDLMHTW